MESKCQLMLNNVAIEARDSDSFINATQLCKAGGKEFSNWFHLDGTQSLIRVLTNDIESNLDKSSFKNVKVIEVIRGRYGGSWIHPDLAVQLAQWISPEFAIQVSRWVRQLLTTGSVSLESTVKALEQQLENEHKELEKEREERAKVERKLFRTEDFINTQRRLHKKEVIYIGTSRLYQGQNRFKVGGCATQSSLKSRFKQYNTGRVNEDTFFCIRYWDVHSFTMNEKIIKTVLQGYRDTRSNEMYHIHGASLIEAVDYIVQNSSESIEWFNEHFHQFNRMISNEEPSCFPPIVFPNTLAITDGSRQVELVDITDWPDEKVEAEIDSILEAYCELKKLDHLQDNPIAWGDLSAIIRQRHKRPVISDWRAVFRNFLPRRPERLLIKGLKI